MTHRELIVRKYKRMLEERRGNNFEYWNEGHDKMLLTGWNVFEFKSSLGDIAGEKESTCSVEYAKEELQKLRQAGNFARIVCGYDKNQQRQKRFTIIFKPKKK